MTVDALLLLASSVSCQTQQTLVVAANSPHVYSLSDAVFAVAAVVGEKRAVEKVQCFFFLELTYLALQVSKH